MKVFPIVAALLGLAVIAVLIAVFGVGAVLSSLTAIGWRGFAAVCLIHLALMALMGIAWRGLVPSAPIWPFLWGRLVRDAGSEVLPLSPVGGCVLGVRALSLAGISGSIAAASTIVDLTLEFFAKLAYTGLGLVLLIGLQPGSQIALPLTAGLAAAGVAAVGFVAAQHHSFGLFDRLARILGRGWAERIAAGTAALRAALVRTYQRKAGLWAGFFLHLA
jgi:glycosyltransferase 2 family protein